MLLTNTFATRSRGADRRAPRADAGGPMRPHPLLHRRRTQAIRARHRARADPRPLLRLLLDRLTRRRADILVVAGRRLIVGNGAGLGLVRQRRVVSVLHGSRDTHDRRYAISFSRVTTIPAMPSSMQ